MRAEASDMRLPMPRMLIILSECSCLSCCSSSLSSFWLATAAAAGPGPTRAAVPGGGVVVDPDVETDGTRELGARAEEGWLMKTAASSTRLTLIAAGDL